MIIECPILRRCVRNLRLIDTSVPELRIGSEIAELEDVCTRAPAGAEYTQLRGFVVIETMLQNTLDLYARYKTTHTPDISLVLSSRAWSGLGEVKRELKKLLNDVQLEIGDYQLSGDMKMNGVMMIRPGSSTSWRRMAAAKTLTTIIPILLVAIDRFRPALRNDSIHAELIVNDLYEFFACIHESWQPDPLIRLTLLLAELRI